MPYWEGWCHILCHDYSLTLLDESDLILRYTSPPLPGTTLVHCKVIHARSNLRGARSDRIPLEAAANCLWQLELRPLALRHLSHRHTDAHMCMQEAAVNPLLGCRSSRSIQDHLTGRSFIDEVSAKDLYRDLQYLAVTNLTYLTYFVD